ncbi:hypothetical protein BCR34DRAFT_601359 [Clohesyomyces aquaticus]|uniref:Uncharacterized protein n=1 Tax=Clohesyomyces aquaticus TaxID=1231657 RepID=A0A1Y1ZMF3_9PLEO|nr:hypothetical protein BCR34DRAFT_601359 [Clohesyomyces aquaticus]
MRPTYLLPLSLALLVAAAPAPTGCPNQHCYTATNECSMSYGGCWDECESPLNLQTFTKPHCPTSVHPLTSEPPHSSPNPTPAPTSCSPLMICIDAITVCNGETMGYGDCFDTCTQKSVDPPPCKTMPVTITAKPTSSKKPKPTESEKPCTHAESWMCKPANW